VDRKAMLLGSVRRLLQPTEVCVGRGCMGRLAALDGRKALVAAARSAEKSGALATVTTALAKAGVETAVWQGDSLEPTPQRVSEIAARATEHEPDWIVALGGGAIIDAAKLAWACYAIPSLDLNVEKPAALVDLRRKARFIAIPTTAGAGSEASQVAVLSDEASGRKVPWVSPHLIPDVVILDPASTTTLTSELTAVTGLDALAHAIEAYASRLATPLVKTLASASIRAIMRHLPEACQNPTNLESRQGMLDAAYLAGLCQSTASTGLAHAVAHSAAWVLKAHHAPALAVFLLPTVKYNAAQGAAAHQSMALDLGFPGVDPMLEAFERWMADLPIPRSWQALAGREPTAEQLAELVAGAMADICLRTNPARPSEVDLQAIFEGVR